MGGGKPKNKQSNKKAKTKPKKRTQLSNSDGGPASPGSAPDACVISFEATLILRGVKDQLAINDTLHFVPSKVKNTLDVYLRRHRIGAYSGPKAHQMWRCANDRFEYHGQVNSISQANGGVEVVCHVETYGRE